MSKKKPTKFWIDIDIIQSDAFNSLTGYAPQLLFHVLKKKRYVNHSTHKKKDNWVCTNSDSLNITYVEFQKAHDVSKPRLSKAIGQLLARGFIKIIHRGGGCNKDKSIFALSNQWMLWRRGVVFEKRKKENVCRGFCKPKKQT